MMDDLQNEIKRGVRLRPTKTRDGSAPIVHAPGDRFNSQHPTATTPPPTPPPLPTTSKPPTFEPMPPISPPFSVQPAPNPIAIAVIHNGPPHTIPPPPPPPIPPPGLLGPPKNPKAPSNAALLIHRRIAEGPKVNIEKLFDEIKGGKALRRTVTIDKSAPFIERNSCSSNQVLPADQPDSSSDGNRGNQSGLTDQIVRELHGNRCFEKARAECSQAAPALMQMSPNESLLVDVGQHYGSSSISPQSGDKCWSPRSSSGVSSGHSPGKISITKESKNPSPLSMASPSSSEEDKFHKHPALKSPGLISALPELPISDPPTAKSFHQDLLVTKLVQQANSRSATKDEQNSRVYPAPKSSPVRNGFMQTPHSPNSASSTFVPKSVAAPGKVTFSLQRNDGDEPEFQPEVVNARTEPIEPISIGSSIQDRKRSLSLHQLNRLENSEPAKERQQSPIESDELANLPNVRKMTGIFQQSQDNNGPQEESSARRSRRGSRSSSSSANSSDYGDNIRKKMESFQAQSPTATRPLVKAASTFAINQRVNSLPSEMSTAPTPMSPRAANGTQNIAAAFNGDGKAPKLLPDVRQIKGMFEQANKSPGVKQPVGTGVDHYTPKKYVKNPSNGQNAEKSSNASCNGNSGVAKEGDRTVYYSQQNARQRSASALPGTIANIQSSASSCEIGPASSGVPANARVVSRHVINSAQLQGGDPNDPSNRAETLIYRRIVSSRNGGPVPSNITWVVPKNGNPSVLQNGAAAAAAAAIKQQMQAQESMGASSNTCITTEETTLTTGPVGARELERRNLSTVSRQFQMTVGLETSGVAGMERRSFEQPAATK